MRDTRRRRLILVVLILLSLTLIALGGGSSGPGKALRSGAAAVFGPVQRAVAGAFQPVHNFFGGLSQDDQRRLDELQKENDALKQQLRTGQYDAQQLTQLSALYGISQLGQYTVKAARVISIGPAQGFANTALLDMGSNDGLKVDMTVINGDGLVGRIKSLTGSTATVLLAIDPVFKVGARIEKSLQVGYVAGAGTGNLLNVHMLKSQAVLNPGDRMVTWQDGTFPGGVPIGELVDVTGAVGSLDQAATLRPYVDFTALDIVGVVVVPPRTDPRDAVLPPRPTPSPSPSATASVSANPSASAKPSASATASR